MTLPRVNVTTSDAEAGRGAPTEVAKAIIVGETQLGGYSSVVDEMQPVALTSMRGWKDHVLGERTGSAIPTWNAVDVAFREGYPLVYVARPVGPAAVAASLALNGPTSGVSVTATAASVGEWANGAAGGLKLEAVNGPNGASERVLIVYRGGSTSEYEVERSPVVTTRAELLEWADPTVPASERGSKYITLAAGANVGLPVVVAATNMTGGDADEDGIGATQIREALERVPRGIGPAQVFAPWRTAAGTHEEILDHCGSTGGQRVALLDGAQGASVSTLAALAASSRALGLNAEGVPRLGGLWCQYAVGPGITPGTTRTVPGSIVVGGMLALAVAQAGHANVQPVGEAGVPRWATRMDRYFDDSEGGDGDDLTDAGVNVFESYLGRPRNATFDSLDDPDSSEWGDLAHSVYFSGLVARAEAIGKSMQDGRRPVRQAIPRFGGLLRLELAGDFAAGAHEADTPEEAFRVDVDTVNDDETIAAGELNAGLQVKVGEHVRDVNITIAKTPATQSV